MTTRLEKPCSNAICTTKNASKIFWNRYFIFQIYRHFSPSPFSKKGQIFGIFSIFKIDDLGEFLVWTIFLQYIRITLNFNDFRGSFLKIMRHFLKAVYFDLLCVHVHENLFLGWCMLTWNSFIIIFWFMEYIRGHF